MAKSIFISFDWDHDKNYKFLLDAMAKNPRFSVSFDDKSSTEINSDNVGRVKAALSRKIGEATYILVIVGQYANSLHQDHRLIGERNWINYEVQKSKELKKRLVGVKIDKSYTSPERLLNSDASWAMSFTEDAITAAIDSA